MGAFVKLRREGILAEVNPDFSTDLDLANGGGVSLCCVTPVSPSFSTRVTLSPLCVWTVFIQCNVLCLSSSPGADGPASKRPHLVAFESIDDKVRPSFVFHLLLVVIGSSLL